MVKILFNSSSWYVPTGAESTDHSCNAAQEFLPYWDEFVDLWKNIKIAKQYVPCVLKVDL